MSDTPPILDPVTFERAKANLEAGIAIGNRLIEQFERDGVTPEEGCTAMAFVAASVLHSAEDDAERSSVAALLSGAMNFYLGRFQDMDDGDGTPTPGPLPENVQ